MFAHPVLTFPDLTPEQQKMLIELRKRKQELLLEIQVIKDIPAMPFPSWPPEGNCDDPQ